MNSTSIIKNQNNNGTELPIQDNVSISLDNLTKLMQMRTAFDEIISELVSLMPAPGRRGHSHKFHGKSLKARPVAMMNSDGSVAGTFPSMSAAARAIGKSLTSVWAGCKNPDKIRVGYKWKYLDVPKDKANG